MDSTCRDEREPLLTPAARGWGVGHGACLVAPLETIAEEAVLAFESFITEEVNPGTAERDEHGEPIPGDLMRRSLQAGLFGYSLPKELGGAGADALQWGVALERIGYLCDDGSFPGLLSLRASIATTLFAAGREDLVERYARPLAQAQLFGAFAYSDGADPFAFSSTVEQAGETLVVNGFKPIVTGAVDADLFLTFVADETTGDLAIVVLERDDPGLSVVPVPTSGLRASGLAALRMEDISVPADRLLLGVDGVSQAQRMLNARRLLLVAPLVGAMQALHEHCIERLEATVRYGTPLTEMQNVQAALGRQYVAVESCRALLYRALARLAGYEGRIDPLFDPLISATKYFVTDKAVELGISALRLLGGRGYLRDRAERFHRDALSLLAGGGTQDVLEIDLGTRAISDSALSG